MKTLNNRMQKIIFAIAVGFALTITAVNAEIVLNGGFETGDFTNWTVVDTSGNTFVDNGSNYTGIVPHSGAYYAALGPVGSLGSLSQTLTTDIGQSYLLSLWLNSPDGDTPNEFLVNWNGSTIFDQTNMPATGWRNLQFVVTATGTNTLLQFQSRNDPSFFGLDDVSVLPTPPGTLKTTLQASYTNAATGFTVNFTGQIVGQSTSNYLDFGDGTVVSNLTSQVNIAHAWATPGDYPVSLVAYNDSNPGGVSATSVVQVTEGISYVRLDSSNPVAPYTSWATAATNIQDAVDAASVGGTVLVTNGVYATGGRPANGSALTNRLTVDKPLTVQSVNGPAVTLIQGYQVPTNIWGDSAVRCAYLSNEVTLAGFTLTNGATRMTGETIGGGAYCDGDRSAILTNCILSGNSAANSAGGAYFGTLNNCTLSGNFATNTYGGGGGAEFSTLNNCTLSNNSAWYGGGAYYCTFNDCTLSSNTAVGPYGSGGGTYYGTLTNCTLTLNSASNYGGGASWATLNDCTLSNNSVPYEGGGAYNSTLDYCTLSGNSAAYQGGGAYASTLNNCIVSSNSVSEAYADGGGVMNSTLTDCTLIGNSATYEGGGAYLGTLDSCTLSGNSASQGGGVYASTMNNCIVSSNSAVGAYAEGGGVMNGTLNNCTLIGNSATGSPAFGGGAFTSTLNDCTLSGNSAGTAGGGAYYSTLNNCTLTNNSSAHEGGGVSYLSTLTNCLVSGNSAQTSGGGADNSTLVNCTVVNNQASISGGGVSSGTLNNCIVYYNSAPTNANFDNATLFDCCTSPDAGSGAGNFTNDPAFVNLAGGDFHLQSSSPSINSGNNAYVITSTDLDGNPRIRGGTVDIGAYEFQNPDSIISYAWLQQYGLPADGSVDYSDLDGTTFNVYQDWIAGLNPTNAASVLTMQTPQASTNAPGVIVSWLSVSNRTYYLQQATNLAVQPAFSTIQSNISGNAGATSFTDTSATNGGPYFYRVGVQH